MKIKVSELKPNPFKKEINKGKLNYEQVQKLKQNLDKLGFFGSLPVFKKGDKYFLISGHHRVQALKEKFGKDYEVAVDVKDYIEDQIFRGMVIENLTHRAGDFRELKENIVAIESYINTKPEILGKLRESRNLSPEKIKHLQTQNPEATSSDISFWIDDKSENVIYHDEVTQLLNIHHRLDEDLQEEVSKKHDKTRAEREEGISYTQAVYLSGIKDKQEQKDLAKVLKNSREQRVREQGKLISMYKDENTLEKVKKQVRKGEFDIADISFHIRRKEEIEEKLFNRFNFVNISLNRDEQEATKKACIEEKLDVENLVKRNHLSWLKENKYL